MDKILILGINGFTGRHFQKYIVKNNLLNTFSFFGVDLSIERLTGINYARINLLDYKKFEKLVLKIKPDYIINLSGVFNHSKFQIMEESNAGISRNVLEIIVKNKLLVKKILLIGSAAEYGRASALPIRESTPLRPMSFYGLSKATQGAYCDYYVRNFNINASIARTFNIIGEGISDSLCVGSFAKQIKKAANKDVIYVGNLKTKRDFLNIEDVVDAYWKILINGKKGETYNVCSGRSYCIKDILKYLINESGKKIKVEVRDDLVRENDVLDSFGDNRKLRKDTGWKEKNSVFSAIK